MSPSARTTLARHPVTLSQHARVSSATETLLGLRRRGFEVEVIAPGGAPYEALLRDSGCPLTRVSHGSGLGPRAARVARDRLKSAPAQILYLEGLRVPAQLFLAPRGMPTRIVARLLYLESNHRLPAVNRWLCRSGRVARILADIDPGSLGDTVAARQLRHKLTIVPSGHDPDWYPMSYELAAFGIPPGAFSVAAVSDGAEHPGMTRLIECVRDLPMDLPIHFLLLAPERRTSGYAD